MMGGLFENIKRLLSNTLLLGNSRCILLLPDTYDKYGNTLEDTMLKKTFQEMIQYDVIPMPFLGPTCIAQTDKGICAIFWCENPAELDGVIAELFPTRECHDEALFVKQAGQELNAYCQGELQTFTVPLDLRGTAFRERVWQALLAIPYGTTASYYDIACAIDNPQGVRAVAQACGANPVSIMVPCHRIIGKNGALTGYTGGIQYKKWLLQLEGLLKAEQ